MIFEQSKTIKPLSDISKKRKRLRKYKSTNNLLHPDNCIDCNLTRLKEEAVQIGTFWSQMILPCGTAIHFTNACHPLTTLSFEILDLNTYSKYSDYRIEDCYLNFDEED